MSAAEARDQAIKEKEAVEQALEVEQVVSPVTVHASRIPLPLFFCHRQALCSQRFVRNLVGAREVRAIPCSNMRRCSNVRPVYVPCLKALLVRTQFPAIHLSRVNCLRSFGPPLIRRMHTDFLHTPSINLPNDKALLEHPDAPPPAVCPRWPLSSEYGTCKTVKARFWPWLHSQSP